MEKWYACDYENCKATFAKPNKLVIHSRTHTGERPYRCQRDGCDKSYTNSSHLNRHVRSAHSQFKSNVVCSKCSLVISSLSNLRRHDSRVHASDNVYPYKCDECTQGFYKKHQLAEHTYIHTGVAPYSCDLCEMKFTTSGKMNKHKRNHKTYECDCGAVFSRWSDYLQHKRSDHKNVYQCDICDQSFSTKTNCNTHRNTHSECRDVFKCPKSNCSRTYVYKKNLIQHMKVSHAGIKYKCTYPLCNKELSSKQKLIKHRNVHTASRAAMIRKKQAKRKDAGTYKCSTLLKLAGLSASSDAQKEIIKGNVTDVEIEDGTEDDDCNNRDKNNLRDDSTTIKENATNMTDGQMYFMNASIDVIKDVLALSMNDFGVGVENSMKMVVLEHKKIVAKELTE